MQITKTTVENTALANGNRVRELQRDQAQELGRRKHHQLGICKAIRFCAADFRRGTVGKRFSQPVEKLAISRFQTM